MVTGNDESKMSEFEDAQQQQQDQEQQQQLETESGSEEDSDPCPAGGALSSKFDRTDTSINTNPLPYGKYTLIGIDIDTTGRRLIDEIVQISAYTPDHQHSQYIMPLMNLNPAARQRHQVRVITVGFFRMLKSMQTYRVVKTKTEISALNEFIGWLEQRAREDPGSEGIVLIYHEQRKFVPYMLIEALKKYNLLDRFAQTVRSFANGFKLAEEKCSKTIKYFSIRQLAKLVLDESEAKDGFEGNAAYRARLAYQIARRLSNDNKESPSGETSQDESSAVAKSDNEPESEDAPTEAADADAAAAPVAPAVSTGAIPKASRDMGNYTASPSDENTNDSQQQEQPQQQQQEDPEEDDHSGTDVDVVTGHVTTIPEPQPRSRPTTEAEREKMCAVLCELASPITCEISELDEQEVILVRQNSLRPVFLQYFKTTIYHRVKAVTYRRVLAEYGHDFASLHQIWTESKREGLEHVTAKIVELKDDERAELVELLDCHYDPDKQQLKPIVKRIRPRSNRGPGRPFFGNKNNNAGNGVGNPNNNNNNNKENRKPMGGRNSAGNNSNNNGTFYANNSNINNNNNNGKHNNNNQPPSPNGNGNGAGGKKFRQRQPRRRRSNQNNKSDAPQNFQNQPQMIQTNA